MIQTETELDKWYSKSDPWNYEDNPEDLKRKDILLSQIPKKPYLNVLDIGCGQGFLTKDLPGENVLGVDISGSAIEVAKKNESERIKFIKSSLFEMNRYLMGNAYDLIIITGVLYEQYIGNSSNLVYMIIDNFLEHDGILISVHIDDWYRCRFPYLKLKDYYYEYREYVHMLEVYIK